MFYAHRCLSKHQNSPVSRTAVIILTICLLFFTASAGLAFAEDGDGTGGGNGDGSGKYPHSGSSFFLTFKGMLFRRNYKKRIFSSLPKDCLLLM